MSAAAQLDSISVSSTAVVSVPDPISGRPADGSQADFYGGGIDVDEVLREFRQQAGRLQREFSRCSQDHHELAVRRARLMSLGRALRRRRNEWRREQSKELADLHWLREQLAEEQRRIALAESRLQAAQRNLGEQFAQLVAERQEFAAEQTAARTARESPEVGHGADREPAGEERADPEADTLKPDELKVDKRKSDDPKAEAIETSVIEEEVARPQDIERGATTAETCHDDGPSADALPTEPDPDHEIHESDHRANLAWEKQTLEKRMFRKIANKSARSAVAVSVRRRVMKTLAWQAPSVLAAFVAAGVLFSLSEGPGTRWSHLATAALATGGIGSLLAIRTVVRAFGNNR
jgi:hypothetical protein